MIYKVLYQASNDEVTVREKTDSILVEDQSDREVRSKIK
ncbi:RNA polymerase epsilon subunit, partial [Bacillus sp. MBGLi79]